nr:MAG TPA: hypothetical protein [Caudoviricetes sp.]
MVNRKVAFILLATFLLSTVNFAHKGRTNSKGCHTNRKTGKYHCHKKK